MSKFLMLSAALAMFGGVSSIASAQHACGGAQSYQRYSYQPAMASPVQALQGSQSWNANVGSAAAVQPQAGMGQSQNYRRYSYQPQAAYQSYRPQSAYRSQTRSSYSSGARKAPWEYAKGERGRNTP